MEAEEQRCLNMWSQRAELQRRVTQASPGTGRGFPDEEMGAELRRLAWQRQVGKCGSPGGPAPHPIPCRGSRKTQRIPGKQSVSELEGRARGRVKKALV